MKKPCDYYMKSTKYRVEIFAISIEISLFPANKIWDNDEKAPSSIVTDRTAVNINTYLTAY